MQDQPSRKYAPDEVNEDGEYIKIGGSPMPGLTLRQIIGHSMDIISQISWSPDGSMLASPHYNGTIQIWDIQTGKKKSFFKAESSCFSVTWEPGCKIIGAGFRDSGVCLWELKTNAMIRKLEHFARVNSVEWLANENSILTSDFDGYVRLWNIETGEIRKELNTGLGRIWQTSFSPDRRSFALISDIDNVIVMGEVRNGNLIVETIKEIFITGQSRCIAWMPKGYLIAVGSSTGSVALWDVIAHKIVRQLEGHTGGIKSISFSCDGRMLATKSKDGTVNLWRCDKWEIIAIIHEVTSEKYTPNLAFHPIELSILATLGQYDSTVRIWDMNYDILVGNALLSESVPYTTAKLVLVGDSGVGKTGLGWRLAHGEFKEHASTHGQQFWAIPELGLKRKDGTECEAVLWDLAGQHIYRSIHSIFLDNVDAALVLFDPSNRQDPLKGAQFWLEQLKGKTQLPPTVLVGARVDRGAPVLSQQELEQFCQKYGVSGGYLSTSAKSGEGLAELLEKVKAQIPWDQMTATVTTVTFKRIKDYVLGLKEKPDRKGVSVSPDELQTQLVNSDPDWLFNDAQMMTAVGHLANHGYVSILHSSSGEEYILLVPELLASVAASIFLLADKHPRELGAVNETDLLHGKYPIDEIKGLEKQEQLVLLDAAIVRFLEHSICFRETLGNDTLLIFPSLIKQKRPLQDEVPASDDISYIVRGRVENIYAMLVVLLGYTPSFTRINQWANQAQYEMEKDQICGFRLVEDRESEIELILYYAEKMPLEGRQQFQELFEQFLYQRDVEVTPFPPVACPNGHRQERATVIKRIREGKQFLHCDECGAKTDLPNLEQPQTIGIGASEWLKREEAFARLRNTYEAHLSRVKGYRRQWAVPRCYLSYVEDQREFAETLTHDLNDAGVFVVAEVSKVEANDFIIILDTPVYKKAWDTRIQALQEDCKLIQARLAGGKKNSLVSIKFSGAVITHDLQHCLPGFFHDPTHYVMGLFELVLNLYAIPFSHAGFAPLRQSLHQQWEQSLAKRVEWKKMPEDGTPPSGVIQPATTEKEIFISYAWGGESEKLVNELDTAFQNRGVAIVRDKRDLGFKGRIKGFMQTIGKGKAIILVISEKYLKSENCLYELLQVSKNGDFFGRIFPVILEDARIYKATDRIQYVEYWEKQIKDLDKAMKRVSATNLDGFREDIDLFAEIRANLPKLTDILKDMNALTPSIHRDTDFQQLFEAVMAKLEE